MTSNLWLRLLLLVLLGTALAAIAYLIQQKYPPKKPNRPDPYFLITVLVLASGTSDALSGDSSIGSQACVVGLVALISSWLIRARHGG